MPDPEQPPRRNMSDPAASPADVATIVVSGYLTPACVVGVQRRVAEVARGGRGHIVVDLAAVDGFSTRLVAMFCGALRRGSAHALTVRIVGAAPVLHRAVELCDIPGVELSPARGSSLTDPGAPPGPPALSPVLGARAFSDVDRDLRS